MASSTSERDLREAVFWIQQSKTALELADALLVDHEEVRKVRRAVQDLTERTEFKITYLI
jgi:hypothetical protein